MSYREITAADIPALHPVARFSAFWHDKKGDDAVPLRADIEPTKIPAILPWLLLLEVVDKDGTEQFRYRLTGTGCREIFGIDYTGKFLGEGLTPEGTEIRRREFLRVTGSGQPIYSWSELPIAERDFMTVYRGVFPVSRNGERVDQIFLVIAQERLELPAVVHAARPHRQQGRMNIL
ncbi:MAG: PAS domain-containing protein [Parvibaculum sp.]|uniref:PAS domain-containing protein n=1 Tax=Parvibaculum sp. TaxID=2024848 RepID=UPI0025F307A2|nr:PAS domain-containing protein [Parvibaculum sp.]MCE9649275.1 PAS domain-containing protein [Parvibaculum sp.]